jgi:hypothetical protein
MPCPLRKISRVYIYCPLGKKKRITSHESSDQLHCSSHYITKLIHYTPSTTFVLRKINDPKVSLQQSTNKQSLKCCNHQRLNTHEGFCQIKSKRNTIAPLFSLLYLLPLLKYKRFTLAREKSQVYTSTWKKRIASRESSDPVALLLAFYHKINPPCQQQILLRKIMTPK